MLPRKEFERRLRGVSVIPTGEYSADGLSQLWRKPDGNKVTIPVYDEYPEYMLNKFLEHYKLAYLPLYNSNQQIDDEE